MEDKQTWTPLKIVQWAVPFLAQKGLPNPKLDAEILVAHALQIDRLKVYLQFDRPLDPQELSLIRGLFQRRSRHEPIQYITGKREFYGHSFSVAPGVLIPRPETELLVEKALDHLKGVPEEKRHVLDLGTGSGCIAISIAKAASARVWAVDISAQALEQARNNAENLGISNIQWRQGSWFQALQPNDPPQFQVVVSNPPYIPLEERDSLALEVREYEPFEALFAENAGLKPYEEIAENLKKHLVLGGLALFELHANSYDKVSRLFKSDDYHLRLHQDLQGFPRVLTLEKAQKS